MDRGVARVAYRAEGGGEGSPLSLSFTMVCCFQGHGQRWVAEVGGQDVKKKRWGIMGLIGKGKERRLERARKDGDEMKYVNQRNENI